MRTGHAVDVDVWWAEHRRADPAWLPLLEPGERERYDAYRRPDDRARFLTGATLVRRLFAQHLGVQPARVRLTRTCPDCPRPHGKVRLDRRAHPQGPPMEVSVSHSGQWVVVSTCRSRPVGVDVERLDPTLDHAALGRFALPSDELRALRDLPVPARAAPFTQRWARREAAVKATGAGLRVPVGSLELVPAAPGGWIGTWPGRPDLPVVRVYDLDSDDEHRAAVAVLGSEPAVIANHDAAAVLR
ncbi:4'-phosphopantetheinyl transferase family protein [Micromonospora parathelypteridis]|uniref:4'-phosphopantetheinyl transferase n=1 Tax=Micromonospora parathelypteridis TaxID=1839617 RepID=A0A840W432_9ACTN|nr:4'-phosphopantetheinyl transferase superfamily protein [Micromonospora parathelypteridis]MBB5480794.1 4'-phosphopantetheinyl transferase [Micromonospora parathelypteridis]GGO21593.1 4'-phosphopantetheinyl transferase [Micromonospora parathelypteridis]